MKQRAPAFQFYPRQFAGDDQVMGMDLEAVGAHILLMCAAASSPDRCRIDADEYAIRMRLRNPADEAWERIKKQLLGGAWKLSADGNWWVQDGLQRTFQKQREFSEQQSQRANARWGNNNAEDVPNSCRNNAGEMPEGVPEGCSSSSSSSSNKTMSSKPDAFDAALEEIFHYYLVTLKKNPSLYRFTDERKRKGMARLKECCRLAKEPKLENAIGLMKVCIDRLAASKFHNGRNRDGKKWLDWEILFRSEKKLTWWLDDDNHKGTEAAA